MSKLESLFAETTPRPFSHRMIPMTPSTPKVHQFKRYSPPCWIYGAIFRNSRISFALRERIAHVWTLESRLGRG